MRGLIESTSRRYDSYYMEQTLSSPGHYGRRTMTGASTVYAAQSPEHHRSDLGLGWALRRVAVRSLIYLDDFARLRQALRRYNFM